MVLELRVWPGANQSRMTEWTTWRDALRSWSLIVLYNEDCVIATSPSQRCRDTPVKGLNEISRELLYFFVSIRGNTMADSTRRQRSLVLSKRGIQCRLIRRASCRRDSPVYRSGTSWFQGQRKSPTKKLPIPKFPTWSCVWVFLYLVRIHWASWPSTRLMTRWIPYFKLPTRYKPTSPRHRPDLDESKCYKFSSNTSWSGFIDFPLQKSILMYLWQKCSVLE